MFRAGYKLRKKGLAAKKKTGRKKGRAPHGFGNARQAARQKVLHCKETIGGKAGEGRREGEARVSNLLGNTSMAEVVFKTREKT